MDIGRATSDLDELGGDGKRGGEPGRDGTLGENTGPTLWQEKLIRRLSDLKPGRYLIVLEIGDEVDVSIGERMKVEKLAR